MIVSHGGSSTITITRHDIIGAPPAVTVYLTSEGWSTHYVDGSLYFKSSSYAGDFTWEQALLYTAFLKMNLGGV